MATTSAPDEHDDQTARRLRYLNDAAHLIATSSPAISRHLMLSCRDLMMMTLLRDAPRLTPPAAARAQHVCNACGAIMHLVRGSSLRIHAHPRPKKKKASAGQRRQARESAGGGERPAAGAKVLVATCGACTRRTRCALTRATPLLQRGTDVTSSITALQADHVTSTGQGSAATIVAKTAPPKRRQRASNKAGLEALLARRQAEEESQRALGGGFDLMDFMKKS